MAKKKAKSPSDDVSMMTTETIKLRLADAGVEVPKTRNRQIFVDLYNKTFNKENKTMSDETKKPVETPDVSGTAEQAATEEVVEVEIPAFDEITNDAVAAVEAKEIINGDPELQDAKAALKAEINQKIADGIKGSWENPEVRQARMVRRACTVTTEDGTEIAFGSVIKAFEHFNLPRSKHYKMRLELRTTHKETGIVMEHNGVKYNFQDSELMPKPEPLPGVEPEPKKAKVKKTAPASIPTEPAVDTSTAAAPVPEIVPMPETKPAAATEETAAADAGVLPTFE